jgi:hypothetical protein
MPFRAIWLFWMLTRKGRTHVAILRDARQLLLDTEAMPSKLGGEFVGKSYRDTFYWIVPFKKDSVHGYYIHIADKQRPIGAILVGRPICYGPPPELTWTRRGARINTLSEALLVTSGGES